VQDFIHLYFFRHSISILIVARLFYICLFASFAVEIEFSFDCLISIKMSYID